jgi:hypothetical protein
LCDFRTSHAFSIAKNHRQHDQDQHGAIGDGKVMARRHKEDHGGNSSHGMDKAEGEYRNPDDSYEYPKASA